VPTVSQPLTLPNPSAAEQHTGSTIPASKQQTQISTSQHIKSVSTHTHTQQQHIERIIIVLLTHRGRHSFRKSLFLHIKKHKQSQPITSQYEIHTYCTLGIIPHE
jgi:hypothetical protein